MFLLPSRICCATQKARVDVPGAIELDQLFLEAFGYPALAKICHQRLGTLTSIRCRVIDFDVRERFWALDAIVDAVMAGSDAYRARIAAARPKAKATA